MNPLVVEALRANNRFLVLELQRRGIEVDLIDWDSAVFEARHGGRRELLVGIEGSAISTAAAALANHKYLAKQLLARAGLSVPKGERFHARRANEAILYAADLGYPVVVKPCIGSQGTEVHLGLSSMGEVEAAIDGLLRRSPPGAEFLVEAQFSGHEHRVFISAAGEYAVVHRDPAHVIGDGERSIRELALAESYRRMNPRRSCLCSIVLDGCAVEHLGRQGRSVDDVPGRGEKVYVRANSNIFTGATCEDVTDLVHPSVLELARRALAAIPGLPYLGLDFMSTDIGAPQTDATYRIIELNSNPAIGIHINPGRGRSRNVAAVLADLLFPSTRTRPLPLAGALRPIE